MEKFIGYYRVSTKYQEASGLGISAQKYAVQSYVTRVGGEIIKEFSETESGGNKDKISVNMSTDINRLLTKRPILREAIEFAKANNATIIVKEASRLTRYPFLMEFLINSKVKFRAADSPTDNELMLRIKTALAADELLKVSERTIAALEAKKRTGWKATATKKLTREASFKGAEAIKRNAQNNAHSLLAIDYIKLLREKGLTYKAISEHLNIRGFKTPRGKTFEPTQVKRLCDRKS